MEHKADAIIKFSLSAGCPNVLVCRIKLNASGDTLDPQEILNNGEDLIRALEQDSTQRPIALAIANMRLICAFGVLPVLQAL